MFASTAILAALRARETTGEGQLVDVSLMDSQVALLTNVASNHLVGGAEHRRLGNSHPNIAPYEAFPAQDKWFVLAAGNEALWERLCDVIGKPELRDDPRFQDNGARVSNRAALREVLCPAFRTRPAEEWLAEFRAAGLPCGPINTIPEVFEHPQRQARELVLETHHPAAGPVHTPGFPYKLSDTPAEVRRPPPQLGEHTEEVLTEVLDYSPDDVQRLRDLNVL
jgi:crotonobetainyl-CoA:carnitine CoA-transferase CaiB-like acyl-CoA transferase